MSAIPTLLANAAGESRSVADALPHLLGFVVVLATLFTLLKLCTLVSKILQHLESAPEPPTPEDMAAAIAAATPATVRSTEDDSMSPELVAVIAAATAAVVGHHAHRVVSIKPHSSTWSQAGRQQLQASHNIR